MTEAIFGFLGVLVGAGVTIAIEQLRVRAAGKQRRADWRREMLERLTDTIDRTEALAIDIMHWRETEYEAGNGLRALPKTDPRSSAFAEALRKVWIVSGPYLGDELHNSVSGYREKTSYMVSWVHPHLLGDGGATENQINDAFSDLGNLSRERAEIAEATMELLHQALADAVSES